MSDQGDRRLNLLLVLATIIMIVVVVSGGITIMLTLSGNSNSQQLRDQNATQACRAVYSARSTDAQVKMFERKAELDVLTNQLVRAIANEDAAAVQEALKNSSLKEAEVLAAIAHAEEKVSEFQAAVERSNDHPDSFRQECA